MAEDDKVNIEIANEDSLIGFFNSLPKVENLVRLFDHGAYYTLHGENAEQFAQTFLNTIQAIRYLGPEKCRLASVAISSARYEPFLRHILVDNNYRVEIYTKSTNKGKTCWTLDIKASPGYLGKLEDILDSTNAPILNQHVSAILVEEERVYLVSINVFDCTIHIGSFIDNSSYTTLESLIVRFAPKECLLPKNLVKDGIRKILLKNNILFSEYRTTKKSNEDIESILLKLLKESFHNVVPKIVETSGSSLIPLDALIEYLNLLNDRYCYSNYHLNEIEIDSFVRLDMSSITNLHLFPSSASVGGSITGPNKKIQSLFQVLNHCKSASGRKLLDNYIRQPLTNIAHIEQRLDCVEFFRDNSSVLSSFNDHFLEQIPDITKIYKKLTNGRVRLEDVYQVYNVHSLLPNMCGVLENIEMNDAVRSSIFDQLKLVHEELEPFRKLTFNTLDLARYYKTRELWIKPEIDEELVALKGKMDDLQEKSLFELATVQKHLRRTASIEPSVVQLESDKNGFFFRATKQYGDAIAKLQQYTEISSGKVKDCKFVNSAIEEINQEYLEISSDYDRLQQRFIAEFLDQVRAYNDTILALENVLAYIDVMVSFARASQQTVRHYVRPKMYPKGSGRIVLKEFRHPIIEMLKEMDFVANDVELDATKGKKIFVITGANMGGKSTLIRSVAVNVLLAQIGSFVPCELAEVSIVDAIYTRISAADCPQLGLSTFMAEMVESSAIIRSASENSLIVIDELGRSTGTFDGFGLAHGITEHLANSIKSYTLFATHFHQLAQDLPNVGRLAMKSSYEGGEFHNHYRAEPGTAEQSFGIELAKQAHLPENIITAASTKLQELERVLSKDVFDKVVSILEERIGSTTTASDSGDESSLKAQIKQNILRELHKIDLNQL